MNIQDPFVLDHNTAANVGYKTLTRLVAQLKHSADICLRVEEFRVVSTSDLSDVDSPADSADSKVTSSDVMDDQLESIPRITDQCKLKPVRLDSSQFGLVLLLNSPAPSTDDSTKSNLNDSDKKHDDMKNSDDTLDSAAEKETKKGVEIKNGGDKRKRSRNKKRTPNKKELIEEASVVRVDECQNSGEIVL